MLDLSRTGLDLWIEAVMNGRRPPKPLPPDELEGAVQAALQHWHQPSWLEDSPLAGSAEVAIHAPGLTGAEAVRRALHRALEVARAHNGVESQTALRALELAYIHNGARHETVAEDLAVSRATWYRLLKRGVHVLAEQLAQGGASES